MKFVIMNDELYVGVDNGLLNSRDSGIFTMYAFNMFNGVEDWRATVYGGVRGTTQDITFIDMVGSQ